MHNQYGSIFSITTWGESHGPAIGVVIDGCPAGLSLSPEDFLPAMARRRPGQLHTSPRQEPDLVTILSGVYQNKTTGTPISLLIETRMYPALLMNIYNTVTDRGTHNLPMKGNTDLQTTVEEDAPLLERPRLELLLV